MYTNQAKLIFGPYHNGARDVYADPVAVYRRLVTALDGRPNHYLDLAAAEPPRAEDPAQEAEAQGLAAVMRAQAEERLVTAARVALNLLPFDPATGEGVGDARALATLYAFVEFVAKNE